MFLRCPPLEMNKSLNSKSPPLEMIINDPTFIRPTFRICLGATILKGIEGAIILSIEKQALIIYSPQD